MRVNDLKLWEIVREYEGNPPIYITREDNLME
jgi:hypothetical protein